MSGLDYYRQTYPDTFKDLNDYEALKELSRGSGKPLSEVADRLGVELPSFGGEMSRGISRGIDGIQGNLYGLAALGADAVGATGVRDWAMQGARRNQQEAQAQAAAVPEMTRIGGLRDAFLYAPGVIGEQVPQLPMSLTAAGLGAKVATKNVAALATERALASGLSAKAAREAGAQAASRAATLGAYGGGAGYGAMQESGSNFVDIYDKTGEFQPLNALGHGIVGGALEGLSDVALVKGIAGGIPKGMSRKAYVAKETGKQAAISGLAEEAPQDLISQHALDMAAPGYTYDFTRTLNAAGAGAVGGGAIGGPLSALAPRQKGAEPGRSLLDKGLDAMVTGAGKAGELAARAKGKLEDRIQQADEERGIRSFLNIHQDESDADLSSRIREEAPKLAQKILTNPREYRNEGVRQAAADFAQHGDDIRFRAELREAMAKQSRMEVADSFDVPGAKASKMTPEGEELSSLANAWLSREGKRHSWLFDESDDGKALGAKLFGWIKSDFGRTLTEDGDVHLPRAMLDELGDKASEVVTSAVTAARKQGWAVNGAGDIEKMVRQYSEDQSGDVAILKNKLRYDREQSWDDKMLKQFAKELRESRGELDRSDAGQYKWMKRNFSQPTEVLDHFKKESPFYKNKKLGFKQPVSESGLSEDGFENGYTNDDQLGDVVDAGSDANITDDDGDWNSGVGIVTPESKTQYLGAGIDNDPVDVSTAEGKEKIRSKVSAYANDHSSYVRDVGVWDRVKNEVHNKETRRKAEDALLMHYLPEMVDANFSGELNPADLNAGERASLLFKINKQFRHVMVDQADNAEGAHKISRKDIQSFRVENGRREKDGTFRRDKDAELAENGFVYLERKIGKNVSQFPTTTSRLLQHMRGKGNKLGAANVERDVEIEDRDQGASGTLKHVEQALSDVIGSDNTFTGRIGYRPRAGADIVWLSDKDTLPSNMPLGKFGGSVGFAKKQRATERRVEGYAPVRYAENYKEKLKELKRLKAQYEAATSEGGESTLNSEEAWQVSDVLRRGMPSDVNRMYLQLRNRWEGNADGFGGTPGGGLVGETGKVIPDKVPAKVRRTQRGRVGAPEYQAHKSPVETTDHATSRGSAGYRSTLNPDAEVVSRSDRTITDQEQLGKEKARSDIKESTGLSETEEMALSAEKKLNDSVRKFEETTGESLSLNISAGMQTAISKILDNARKAWKLGNKFERDAIERLIKGKKFSEANKLADKIRFSNEEVGDVSATNNHARVSGQTRPGNANSTPTSRGSVVGGSRADSTGANEKAGELRGAADATGVRNSERRDGYGSGVGKSGAVGDSKAPDNGSVDRTGSAPSGASSQLQTYLDQFAEKNKLWASAARAAIATNDAKRIDGALAAAKKQFGEIKSSRMSTEAASGVVRIANLSSGQKAALKTAWNDFVSIWQNEKINSVKVQVVRFNKLAEHLKTTGREIEPYSFHTTDHAKQMIGAVKSYLSKNGVPVEDTLFVFAKLSGNNPDHHTAGVYFKTFNAIAINSEDIVAMGSSDSHSSDFLLTLLHEGGHRIDHGKLTDALPNYMPLSSFWNNGFGVTSGQPDGVYAKEAYAAWKSGEYAKFLEYPFDPFYQVSDAGMRSELFAQMFSLAKFDPAWASVNMPEFMKLLTRLENAKSSDEAELIIAGTPTKDDLRRMGQILAGATPLAFKHGRAKPSGDRRGTTVSGSVGTAQTKESESRSETGDTEPQNDSLKKSQQSADDTRIDPEQAIATIKQAFGEHYPATVEPTLGGDAGQWTEHGIRLAVAAPRGTEYHEMLHEFFSQLSKHGASNVKDLIQRVAKNPMIQKQLKRLLANHPAALAQLNSPEEAAAFMYQFNQLGLLKLGPEAKNLFQVIKNFIAKTAKQLLAMVDQNYRDKHLKNVQAQKDLEHAFKALETINSGKLATQDASAKQEIFDGLKSDAEQHAKIVQEVGKTYDYFLDRIAPLFFSAEARLDRTKDRALIGMMRVFHQKAGTAMLSGTSEGGAKWQGGYLEATHYETNRWLAELDTVLAGLDQADLELARPYLESGKLSGNDDIDKVVKAIWKFNEKIFKHLDEQDVRRLDHEGPGKPKWVKMEARRNYFSQVWGIDELMNGREEFLKTILEKHRSELEHIAAQANLEVFNHTVDGSRLKPGTAADMIVKEHDQRFKEALAAVRRGEPMVAPGYGTATAETVAEAIYTRLLNSQGMIDIDENESSMGITPGASAINRRQLDWLDKEAFSKFKSKDVGGIMQGYIRNMIKRAEYQKRFGYGGEKITDAVDRAFLRKVGGDNLVRAAESALPEAIKEWNKEAAAWHEQNPNQPYPVPFPTLRLVGIEHDRQTRGVEVSNEAVIKASKQMTPITNSIAALEGTLGNEIDPNVRKTLSWINTYQAVRLLPLMLFTNLNDVIGIAVNGGTLGDSWNAFVQGIKEVKNNVTNTPTSDKTMLRGEMWGAADAAGFTASLGQNYGSVYMSAGAKNVSEKFFKYTGMQGWNRGIRAFGATVAERTIMNWVQNGVDRDNKAEVARFERLYGKGAKVESIKLDPDGNLDISDMTNRAAVNRWVLDAVVSSNAAHRAVWMSDPHYMTFAFLKNFAYSFHRVILKGVWEQAKQGNLRPALVAALGYAPVSIAAGALKEMLIPGEEPPWMKGGLDGYLSYGYTQANLGGVPQMILGDLGDPARLLGPFFDQIQNGLSVPIGEVRGNLSPFKGDTQLVADHKLDEELMSAFPGGTVLKRLVKD